MPLRIGLDLRHARDFGIGTYIRNLIGALARLPNPDARFLLIGRADDFATLGRLPENFELHPYQRSDTGLIHQISFPWFSRQLKADVIHIPLNIVPVAMCRPYVVTVHDLSTLLYAPEPQNSARHNYKLWRARHGLARAARVIAVSDATRTDLEELLFVPPARIEQIYNAIDPQFLLPAAPDPDQQRALERYGITYPYILYAGNIRPQKNIPRLIEAFAVLRDELASHPVYKELRLVIIGDEISKHAAVRRAVIQTRTQAAVRFLGFVPFETLRAFYQAAQVFAFPSLYEGFGLPPLEAMACGAPVVTSSVSSLPEAVGDAAVMVSPENVFSISRGIKEALLDLDLRRSLREKGYQQVRKFRWERTAEQTMAVYREVAGKA
ncbi:MAG: glycosyltransferase family 4 protein [Bryobacteraceae bacterium]|nr:glycosyltransferase family 4 protein [Bryobacteraceae bacterium]